MADNFQVPSNSIDMRLPMVPDTKDAELFRELSIVYTALRQLANGTDKYLDIPPQVKSAPYTITYLDRGQSIDTNSQVTIPTEATAGYKFAPGHVTSIINISNANISIVPATGVTLVLAGSTTTGTRTLAHWGVCTIRRIGTDSWLILGAGVT